MESQTQKNARKSVCGAHKYARFGRWGEQLSCHRREGSEPRLPHPLFDPLVVWGRLDPAASDLLSIPSGHSTGSSSPRGLLPSYQLAENC